jgi:hypothetical protein
MMYHRKQGILGRAVKPLLILMLLIGVFGLVKMRAAIVSVEYDIGELEKKKAELLTQRKALQAEFSAMLSLKSVEGRELELVFPDRERVIYVKRDGVNKPYAASMRRQ